MEIQFSFLCANGIHTDIEVKVSDIFITNLILNDSSSRVQLSEFLISLAESRPISTLHFSAVDLKTTMAASTCAQECLTF